MTNAIRILGIDPGLRRTGWGVIAVSGARLSYVAHGVVTPPATAAFSDRLLHLLEGLAAVVEAHAPDEAAVEEIFVSVNASSTLKLGHARAIALVAPAKAGLTVAEYAAREIKKAVVGTGAADKDQVGFMIRRLLPTCGDPGADAADALAVAITHANLRKLRSLSPQPHRGGGGSERSGEAEGALGRRTHAIGRSTLGTAPPPSGLRPATSPASRWRRTGS